MGDGSKHAYIKVPTWNELSALCQTEMRREELQKLDFYESRAQDPKTKAEVRVLRRPCGHNEVGGLKEMVYTYSRESGTKERGLQVFTRQTIGEAA